MKIELNNKMFNYLNSNQPNSLNSIGKASGQNNVIRQIVNNIQERGDILTISKDAKLNLQLRNLKTANKLEERSDKLKEEIEAKLDLLEDIYGDLGDIESLLLKLRENHISGEEREEIQEKADDMWKDIKDTVIKILNEDEQNVNNNAYNTTVNQANTEIAGINNNLQTPDNNESTIEEITENNDLDVINSEELKPGENQENTSLKDLDINENLIGALKFIGNAMESILEQISELYSQLGEMQDSIDELLGLYVDKSKTVEIIDGNNVVEDDKNTENEVDGQME